MSKKRDPQPLYVPKGKTRSINKTEPVSGNELVDRISDLSLKPKKKGSTENGKILPKVDVPDSWESIPADDIGNDNPYSSDVHNVHSSSDEDMVQQDSRFDYYTIPTSIPTTSDDTELTGLDHVIEIYDFMSSLQTADIAMPFASFKNDFRLKWIDDTHALGVFSSASLARKALDMEYLVFKVRPISEGIPLSKTVAKKCGVSLRPVGDRPKTSASTARRMVANALGVRVNISKEQREKERRELQEAKEKKKQQKLARVDPWKD